MSKALAGLFFFMAFCVFLFGIAFIIYGYYQVDFKYKVVIGSYMQNAEDSISPEIMLENIELSEKGMREEGLVDSDYGAIIFKSPENSMKFQYQHLDSIKERIKSVIIWKDKMYSNESEIAETMGDVYNQKMNNLRFYINENGTRSDWIAKDAWTIKKHPILYFSWVPGLIIIFLILLFILIGAVLWENDY
jgi:hypothetical protein